MTFKVTAPFLCAIGLTACGSSHLDVSATPSASPSQSLSLSSSGISASEFIDQFRAEYKDKVIYKLGSRGPTYYDCSTSIAYIFVKNGMIQQKGATMSVAQFRSGVGPFDPAYMDYDTTNFRVLKSNESLQQGDLILMGTDCANPSHWVALSKIDSDQHGEQQSNWRLNCMVEVKGWGASRPFYFDETCNHPKFKDNNLCAAVRHKSFDHPMTSSSYSLHVAQDTYFKASTAQSVTLSTSQKCFIKAGTTLNVTEQPNLKLLGSSTHLKFTLADSLQGCSFGQAGTSGYIWAGHYSAL